MADLALSQQLLCSDGGHSAAYLGHQARLQLLQGDYSSAAASLKDALSVREQVFTHGLLAEGITSRFTAAKQLQLLSQATTARLLNQWGKFP